MSLSSIRGVVDIGNRGIVDIGNRGIVDIGNRGSAEYEVGESVDRPMIRMLRIRTAIIGITQIMRSVASSDDKEKTSTILARKEVFVIGRDAGNINPEARAVGDKLIEAMCHQRPPNQSSTDLSEAPRGLTRNSSATGFTRIV